MVEGRHFRNGEAWRRTLGDAIDRHSRDELPNKADQPPKGRLLWWKGAIGGLKLAEISPAKVAECQDKLRAGSYQRAKPESKDTRVQRREQPLQYPRKPATANRYLANLSHVFTVARKEWHWASHNPVRDVSRFEERGRVRWLSEDERRARLAETAKIPTLKLEWRDVDLKTGRLLFRKTRNRQAKAAWLLGEALAALKAHGRVCQLSGRLDELNASP